MVSRRDAEPQTKGGGRFLLPLSLLLCPCAAGFFSGCTCDESAMSHLASLVDAAAAAPAPESGSVAYVPVPPPPPEPAPVSSELVYAGACPSDMVAVGATCVDRFEAPNVQGQFPLVMESGVSAEKWCGRRGKRLCTDAEWEEACSGPQHYAYPYGATHVDSRCNDDKPWIDKDESTITVWPEKPAMSEVTRLYQGERSGARAGCVSGYGVYDMTGNVEEWVTSGKHGYGHVLKGCYWAGCYGGSKPTCKWTNAAHADMFKFYETGFRCCADAH